MKHKDCQEETQAHRNKRLTTTKRVQGEKIKIRWGDNGRKIL